MDGKWKKWSTTDDADLWAAVRDGASIEDIALAAGRPTASVKRRIDLLRRELIEVRKEERDSEAARAARAEEKARNGGTTPCQMWLQAMSRIGRQQPN